MKSIFRKKTAYLLIAANVLGVIACKDQFLEVPVTGQLSESQVSSLKGTEALLIGAYAQINGRGDWHGGATNWLWGSIRGGDANKGTNAGDFSSMNPVERYETETVNSEVNTKWRNSYEGVTRANAVLYNIRTLDLPADAAKRIEGEARFLRGHYYFELKKNFNMVPWIDETTNLPAAQADKEVADKSKIRNDMDIWPKIEDDFKTAYNNLDEKQGEAGRANKWAAAAYLAKAYMYQKKYTDAKTLFDLIIANGQTSNGKKYGLFPTFGGLFRLAGENSQESIFAFQATGGAANTNNANTEYAMNMPYNSGDKGPGGCCGFFHPSFDMAASYRTNADGLPIPQGNAYRLGANELKTDQGLQSSREFTPDQGNLDPRLDHTIGRRGIPFLDWAAHPGQNWIRDQSYAGPYTPKKYTYAKAEDNTRDKSGWTPGYTATNFMIIRYADVLLMAAEAEIEVGDIEKAREYINLVRARAAKPEGFVMGRITGYAVDKDGKIDYSTPTLDITKPAANYVVSTYTAPFSGKEEALQAVRFERKLELALEGHRFYDLVRWGIAEPELNSYLQYEASKIPSHFAGARFSSNQDEYLPIPQRQIDLQGADVLEQNDGY